MKLRNRLAVMLLASTVLTSVPTVVMANDTKTVQNDYSDEVRVTNKVTVKEGISVEPSNSTRLVLTDLDADWEKDERVWVRIKNATWENLDKMAQKIEVRDKDGKLVTGTDLFVLSKEEDDVLCIKKNFKEVGEYTVRIPLGFKVDNHVKDGDEISLEVIANEAGLPNVEDVLVGEVASTGVKVSTVKDVPTFAGRDTELGDIIIEENYVGAFRKGDKIELEISDGFEWNVDTTTAPAVTVDMGKDDVEFAYDQDNSNEDTLVLEVTKSENRNTKSRVRVKGLQIRTADKNSEEYGDVQVDVSGTNISDATITVAKFTNYGSTAKVEKEKDFIAGKKVTLPVITLKENAADSITFSRNLDINLPKGVNVVGIKSAKLGSTDVTDEFKDAFEVTKERLEKEGKNKEIVNEGTVNLSKYITKTDKKLELKVEFEVETELTFDGNIDVVFGGRALGEEVKVNAGKVVTPIKVEAELTKLNVGVQDQQAGKIVIKENEKKAIEQGEILIGLDRFSYGEWEKVPTVKVTEGNLKLGEVKLLKNGLISIQVKGTSKTPSTIEITDGLITSSRAIADGKYSVEIGGSAIVDDSVIDSEWADCVKADYLEVSDFREHKTPTTTFTIGQSTYTVDGKTETMDAVPYLSEDRTMVPLKYAAKALGVSDSDILYDKVNKIVTIFNGKDVVQVQINNNILLLNGTKIPMDTKTVISNDRTYLPIAWVAKALGVNYSWDSQTKTVTFSNK